MEKDIENEKKVMKYKVYFNPINGNISFIETNRRDIPEGLRDTGIILRKERENLAFINAYCPECKMFHCWAKAGRKTVPVKIQIYFDLVRLKGCTKALLIYSNMFFGLLSRREEYEKFIKDLESLDLKVFHRIASDIFAVRETSDAELNPVKTASKILSLIAKN